MNSIRNKKQKGSANIAVISVVVLIICGALGFLFWQNFTNKDQSIANKDSPTVSPKAKDTSESPVKFDTSIHNVDIKMKSITDIDQLPSYTPDSFKSYMQQLLAQNTSGQGMFDCGNAVIEYRISKISQVNIDGGSAPKNEQGETCRGGAPAIWVLAPTGVWEKETRNGVPCSSKSGGPVYEEFASECYANDSTFVQNPNGSILSLAK
ncbi:hypothetical protein HY312_00405 [Candidatus Saccharibacteria bacterium]|nr:hypothetical protein [Candidatus Saccharibacteria bacterium]